MDYSFWFDTTSLGWSILYIKGCQVIFFKNVFFCLKFFYSVDPDEMLHHAAFHMGFRCKKYPFRVFPKYKVLLFSHHSVVECLTQDRGAAGSSLTDVTALWSLSMTSLS